MKPERCIPGAVVFYWPVRGGHAYVGTVACEPWLLGDGSLVTNLKNMDADYKSEFGRSAVYAAEVGMLVRKKGLFDGQ